MANNIEYIKKWQSDHKDSVKLSIKKYQDKNREKLKAYCKQYYQDHKPVKLSIEDKAIKNRIKSLRNSLDNYEIMAVKYNWPPKAELQQLYDKLCSENPSLI